MATARNIKRTSRTEMRPGRLEAAQPPRRERRPFSESLPMLKSRNHKGVPWARLQRGESARRESRPTIVLYGQKRAEE